MQKLWQKDAKQGKRKKRKNLTFKQRNSLQLNCPLSLTTYINKSFMKLNEYIDNDSYIFLKKYLNNSSPVGHEMEGQKIWLEYVKKYVKFFDSDSYGNTYGIINKDSKFKVVIEAHADEISWKVNYINENGLIYCLANGDIDHQIAPSMRVNIYGEKGILSFDITGKIMDDVLKTFVSGDLVNGICFDLYSGRSIRRLPGRIAFCDIITSPLSTILNM